MAREAFKADDSRVVLDSPVAGQSTVTFSSLTYVLGTDELFAFHNGAALTKGIHYLEDSTTTVVLLFVPDAIGPDIDDFIFQTIEQGSSEYVPPPATLTQAEPSRRPDNFGGTYVFDV